jgi:hypothetical protein
MARTLTAAAAAAVAGLWLATPLPCAAITAAPLPVEETLFDGSIVKVRMIGDEFGHLHVHEDTGRVAVRVPVTPAGLPTDKHTGHVDWHFADVNETGHSVSTGACVLVFVSVCVCVSAHICAIMLARFIPRL